MNAAELLAGVGEYREVEPGVLHSLDGARHRSVRNGKDESSCTRVEADAKRLEIMEFAADDSTVEGLWQRAAARIAGRTLLDR